MGRCTEVNKVQVQIAPDKEVIPVVKVMPSIVPAAFMKW